MKRYTFAVICLVLCSLLSTVAEESTEKKEEWIQLFNGKDLDGWTPKIKGYPAGENFGDTFRVEDGILKVNYDKYDEFKERFGHLFYKQPFSHYRLRVEYRFTGEQIPGGPAWAKRNSGIMFHGEKPEEMSLDQNFPISIEYQLLGGLGSGNRPTANLCTPGTHVVINGNLLTRHVTNSSSKTYDGDQWVTVELEVNGNKLIRHIIDGKTVLKYSHPQLDPGDKHSQTLIERNGKMLDKGTISLQSESHPIEFRKLELLPLD